jgi:cyclic pyranopterin phosphate synthase
MTSVRFTGGEPLLRKELPDMIRFAKREAGIEDVGVTTNASLLARRLDELMDAGLDRVNISLDAADPAAFERVTQGGAILPVWRGIDAAEAAGLTPVKLNAVVMRGVNDDQIVPLARLAEAHAWHVRFIEYMHLNNAEPGAYHARFFPGSESRARIESALGPLLPVDTDPSAPARLYRIDGFQGRIGFIDPVSNPFCSTCSRMRLTSDGKLRPCLLTDREIDIRDALHAAEPLPAIVDAFLVAAHRKPASGVTTPVERPRTMVAIGG